MQNREVAPRGTRNAGTSAASPVREEGVVFDPATISITSIRIDQPDGGCRARIRGGLGRIRLTVPVDIGFGDVVTLGRRAENYPTLLDLPAPRLWTYPRETLVAEKFHAMASLGDRNSRVKDLRDVVCLARRSRSTARPCEPPSRRPSIAEGPRSRSRGRWRYTPPTTTTPGARSTGRCYSSKSRRTPIDRNDLWMRAKSCGTSSGRSATA